MHCTLALYPIRWPTSGYDTGFISRHLTPPEQNSVTYCTHGQSNLISFPKWAGCWYRVQGTSCLPYSTALKCILLLLLLFVLICNLQIYSSWSTLWIAEDCSAVHVVSSWALQNPPLSASLQVSTQSTIENPLPKIPKFIPYCIPEMRTPPFNYLECCFFFPGPELRSFT